MDPAFYLRVLRKRWPILLVCLLIGTAAAELANIRAAPVYQTSTKLYVAGSSATDVAAAIESGTLSEQRIASYSQLVTSTPVLQRVLQQVGSVGGTDSPKVDASEVGDTLIMEVTVSDRSARRAQAVANAYGVVIPQLIDQIEKPKSGPSLITASVVEPAGLPQHPVSPRQKRNLVLGALLGLLVGGAAALLRESFDTTVKNANDIRAADMTFLGALPFDSDVPKQPLTVWAQPRSRRAEAVRQIRTNISFADVDAGVRTLVVTSSTLDEGKSYVSCNLALAMAQAGEKVILVEADLRRPSVRDYMGIEGAVGLTDVLAHRVSLDEVIQPWGGGALEVLAGGRVPPNPAEILGSHTMQNVVDELRERADYVVLDTPPLLPVTDAAVLSTFCDGVLFVVRAGKTTREQVRRGRETLRRVNARIVGTVLNQTPTKGPDAYSYTYDAYYEPHDFTELLEGELRPARPGRQAGQPDKRQGETTTSSARHALRSESQESAQDGDETSESTGRTGIAGFALSQLMGTAAESQDDTDE